MKTTCNVMETTLTGLNVDGEAITRIVLQTSADVTGMDGNMVMLEWKAHKHCCEKMIPNTTICCDGERWVHRTFNQCGHLVYFCPYCGDKLT